jgi:hypothetical protein
MCTVLVPPGVNPTAFKKNINIKIKFHRKYPLRAAPIYVDRRMDDGGNDEAKGAFGDYDSTSRIYILVQRHPRTW